MYGERQHRRALATTLIIEAYERIRAGAKTLIDWEPHVSMEQCVQRLVDWFDRQPA